MGQAVKKKAARTDRPPCGRLGFPEAVTLYSELSGASAEDSATTVGEWIKEGGYLFDHLLEALNEIERKEGTYDEPDL